MEVRIFRDCGKGRRVFIDKDVRVVIVNVNDEYPEGIVHFETDTGHWNEDGTPATLIG